MSSPSTPSGKVPPRFVPTLTEVVQVPDPAASAVVADTPTDAAPVATTSGAVLGTQAVPPSLKVNNAAPTMPPVSTTAPLPTLVWDDVAATPVAAPQPTSAPKSVVSKPLESKAPLIPASKEVTAASLAAARAAKATSLTMSEMLAKLDALPSKKENSADKPPTLFAAPAFRFESPPAAALDAPSAVEKSPPNTVAPVQDVVAQPQVQPHDEPKPVDTAAHAEVKTPTVSSPPASQVSSGLGTVLAPETPSKPASPPDAAAPVPPNTPAVTFKRWGSASSASPEKIQRPAAPPATFPIVDLPKPSATPAPAQTRVAPPIPEGLEEYLVHRVMQRVDLALEKQLQDAVERVIKDQTQSLVTHLREEVESVVRQSVYEAVAQELVVASAAEQ